MDTQKLQEAGIDPKYWDSCYIANDGTIFTPITDESGQVVKTGSAAYNEWELNLGVEVPQMPTEQQQLAQLIMAQAKNEAAINEINKTNAQLLLKLAQLEGGSLNV